MSIIAFWGQMILNPSLLVYLGGWMLGEKRENIPAGINRNSSLKIRGSCSIMTSFLELNIMGIPSGTESIRLVFLMCEYWVPRYTLF